MTTYTARWVFPVSGPPLERGTVTVVGDRIVAVGPRGPADVDLGNVALIPGLVNAHTHLDLSGARGRVPPTDPEHFTDWLRGVIAYRRSRSPEETQADIRAGLSECLRYGTTLVGDITVGGASYPAVVASPLRAVLFWELIGLSRERFIQAWSEWVIATGLAWENDATPARYPTTQQVRWAASPHAPYSAHNESAQGQLLLGNVAIHLAESPAELELLATRSGLFASFLSELGVWNSSVVFAGLTDFFVKHPPSRGPRLFIHGNYLPPNAPFGPNDTLVYCPRTHAAFGHPPHPFRDFLARGVRVCLGTDSLASNPDLDVLAEARFVHARYPDFPGDALLRMVTLSGAEALGWADEAGSLEAGKSADLVAVPLPDAEGEPHALLFAEFPAPRRTMFRGAWRQFV